MAKSTKWWRKYFEEFPSDVLQDLVISHEEHSLLINEILNDRGVTPNKFDKHEYEWKRKYASLPTQELGTITIPDEHKLFVRNILHERAARALRLNKSKEQPSIELGSVILWVVIILAIAPFILSFQFSWLKGWPVVIYHLVLVGIIASIAFGSKGGDMGFFGVYLVWGLLILIDFPVSLALVAFWYLISKRVESQKHLVATIPTVLFGTIGSYWWYMISH